MSQFGAVNVHHEDMAVAINAVLVENPMQQSGPTLFICGGKVSSGTPVAGNADGSGNSGTIGLTGIPAGAEIIRAELYWNVLTNSDEASDTGKNRSSAPTTKCKRIFLPSACNS